MVQDNTGATVPIDRMPRDAALSAMLASHLSAVAVVARAQDAIDGAVDRIATALTAGHTLFYAAAGSSALMALSDASELPGTFGIAQHQVRICMAGGVPVDGVMPGDVEDDTDAAVTAASAMAPGDVAIVISASGTTPYAMAFATTAQSRGNAVIAIANVAGSPLLNLADVAIALPTAPEIVEGSTRLGAGTAQKVALNLISTQTGIVMGHVHDGLMVNLKPDNIKLRQRAQRIVARIARVSEAEAKTALEQCGYDTKRAVLIASGVSITDSATHLAQAGGRLAACLPGTDPTTTTN